MLKPWTVCTLDASHEFFIGQLVVFTSISLFDLMMSVIPNGSVGLVIGHDDDMFKTPAHVILFSDHCVLKLYEMVLRPLTAA